MNVQPIRTRLCREGESLERFIEEHIHSLSEGDMLVVTSKILSYCESRLVHAWTRADRDALIAAHATHVLSRSYPPLTYSKGVYAAAAGIDESNGNGALVLPPLDAWATAHELHAFCKKKYTVQSLGVLITDSMPLPGRAGVVSMALACAGFHPVRDYRGTKDLCNREFQYAAANLADALAGAAGACMGEGDESRPLAIISNAPVQFLSRRITTDDIFIDPSSDIYKPLADALNQDDIKHI